MKSNVVICGATSIDIGISPEWLESTWRSGIRFTAPTSAWEIDTDRQPLAGAKVTALHPVRLEEIPRDLPHTRQPGGGAYNQAARLAEYARSFHSEYARSFHSEVQVSLVDSSSPTACVRKACAAHEVELFSLGCHPIPVSVVSRIGNDKVTVRSPIRMTTAPGSRGQSFRSKCAELARGADVVACISPKVAGVAMELFEHATAARYFQPTGSLPPEQTFALAQRATTICCNAAEVQSLADAFGMHFPGFDESDEDAGERSVAALVSLRDYGQLHCLQTAVATLGGRGCVVIDFETRQCWSIVIRCLKTEDLPSTPSGAGDYWHAVLIHNREVARLGKAESACEATRTVARAFGLREEGFEVVRREVFFPYVTGDDLAESPFAPVKVARPP